MSEGSAPTTPSATPQVEAPKASTPPPSTKEEPKNQTQTKPEPSGDSKESKEEPKKKELPPAPKMRKIVIDGKEEMVDEEAAWRDYQKTRKADKLLKEASERTKQLTDFFNAFQKDPRAVLTNPEFAKRFNIDLKKIAREDMEAEIEKDLKDPKDTELEDLRTYKQKKEDEEKAAKEEAESNEWNEAVTKQREEISGKLSKIMEGTVLQKDALTLRQAAYYMRNCLKQKIDVSPEDVIRHIENHHLTNYRQTANQYDGDQLIKFLGDDIVAKLRKADIARIKAQRETKAAERSQNPTPPPSRKSGAPEYIDRYSASEMARKKLLG